MFADNKATEEFGSAGHQEPWSRRLVPVWFPNDSFSLIDKKEYSAHREGVFTTGYEPVEVVPIYRFRFALLEEQGFCLLLALFALLDSPSITSTKSKTTYAAMVQAIVAAQPTTLEAIAQHKKVKR